MRDNNIAQAVCIPDPDNPSSCPPEDENGEMVANEKEPNVSQKKEQDSNNNEKNNTQTKKSNFQKKTNKATEQTTQGNQLPKSKQGNFGPCKNNTTNSIDNLKPITGSISIRQIFLDNIGNYTGDTRFRISPDPYSLQKSRLLKDNDMKNDCDEQRGKLLIHPIKFGTYKIEQIDSQYKSVIHGTTISVHQSLPNPILNIVDRNLNSSLLLQGGKIANQLIVTLDYNATDDPEYVANQLKSIESEVEILRVYKNSIKGFSIRVPTDKLSLIEKQIVLDPRVVSTEQDHVGHIAAEFMSQIYPTGIERVDQDITDFVDLLMNNSNYDTKTLDVFNISNMSSNRLREINSDIAIIDTGVSLIHPDLNVYRNVSFVQGTDTGDDDQGHGSHVAGIAAAKDNSLGVVGMAPGARIWAIKVCDKLGSCAVSDQIKAIDYVTEHSDEIDVTNISIENINSVALNNAIARSVAAGVTYVVAAGNSGRNASVTSPADSPDVITVSAISDSDGRCGGKGRATVGGNDDTFGNFSNFGSVVDIAAPGTDILSTYNGTEYGLESGTSMAAPHVSGAVAIYKQSHPLSSPSEVHDWLVQSGSTVIIKCDGKSRGYFTNDPDKYLEPLLYTSGFPITAESEKTIPRGITSDLG